jgi:hypothetical protein
LLAERKKSLFDSGTDSRWPGDIDEATVISHRGGGGSLLRWRLIEQFN